MELFLNPPWISSNVNAFASYGILIKIVIVIPRRRTGYFWLGMAIQYSIPSQGMKVLEFVLSCSFPSISLNLSSFYVSKWWKSRYHWYFYFAFLLMIFNRCWISINVIFPSLFRIIINIAIPMRWTLTTGAFSVLFRRLLRVSRCEIERVKLDISLKYENKINININH